MTKYIKVEWPEYQFFMDHPRFGECCYLVEDNSYMIPEDIYEEFYKPMKKIVILTGSGVSAESGIPTFRGAADSLWEGVNVMEVCSAGCLKKNEENTYAFYNMLRNKYCKCKPNEAHKAIAELEKDYEVTVVTQNVDNLHEQAGSSHVIHLHGELMKCRDTGNTRFIYDVPQDENGEYNIYPTTRIDGRKMRPHVVFFGEDVPNLELGASFVKNADICVVIGTSFSVYPAAGLIEYAPDDCPIYYIDPNPAPTPGYQNITVIRATASEGMKELTKILKENG